MTLFHSVLSLPMQLQSTSIMSLGDRSTETNRTLELHQLLAIKLQLSSIVENEG